MTSCTATTKDGRPCGATPMADSDPVVCFLHSPRAAEAQRRGGETKPRGVKDLRTPRLDNLHGMRRFLRRLSDAALRGDIDRARFSMAVGAVEAATALLRVEREQALLDAVEELRQMRAEAIASGRIVPRATATPKAIGPEAPDA